MPKQIVGKVIQPPEGWAFQASGELTPTGGVTAEVFDALWKWAYTKKYGLSPNLNDPYWDPVTGYNTSFRFKVWADSWETTQKWLGDGTWKPRRSSAKKVSLGVIQYVSPDGISYLNGCANCSHFGLATWLVGPPKNEHRLCAGCSNPCPSCDGKHRVSHIFRAQGSDADKCHHCIPRSRCKFCVSYWPTSEMKAIGGRYVCPPCQEKYKCNRCNDFPERIHTLKDESLCNKCYGKAVEGERKPHEKWSSTELPQGGSLKIACLPNRPVRVMSIETEVDGDPIALATTLYNEGIVREAFVESYGSPCPDGSAWPAFLKRDGSVTGGELINYLVQFDKDDHAESVLNVFAKLRSLEKLDKVSYHENCGGHIHIDAHNFSSDNVWRLVTGYNYLEDVIFRLAGAGCKFGHRTLVPGHDRANNGRGYSHPTAKGPWGVKSNAFRALMQQDRMTGLNFQPYNGAVSYCACGAGAENLRSCKCVLPKCTIEWRVWNSTGHPRILHGWLSFMQSLHAWADTPKEMTNEEEAEYPPFAWTKLPWDKTTAGHKKVALERVEWIFKNLVFTDAEKDSLSYAFQQSDIVFPAGFWKDIAAIPPPKNRTVKAPRNCTIRAEKICIQKPERKVYGDARRDPEYVAQRNQVRADRRLRPRLVDAVANEIRAYR